MKALKKLEKLGLINQLATLIGAGIPLSDAVEKLRESDARFSFFLSSTASRLRKGKSFSESFPQSGLLNRFDRSVLDIAEKSGQLSSGLVAIYKRLEKRHSQLMTLKQKCYLPLATLALAVLATTLITLLRDTYSQAVFQLLSGVAYFLIVVFYIKFFLAQSHHASDYAFHIFWRVPIFRSVGLLRKIIEYNCYYNLTLQLNSGVDAHQAVKALKGLCNEPNYLESVGVCHEAISSGSDLSSALSHSGLVFSHGLLQLFTAAEKSGSFASGLTMYLKTQELEIDLLIDSLTQWLARILYFVVLLIAVSLF